MLIDKEREKESHQREVNLLTLVLDLWLFVEDFSLKPKIFQHLVG